MKNVDDMRVGDFLHLMDCMQEECCEHKKCNGCKYIDFCDVDMPSIDSVSIRRTIEGYAEANGLIENMKENRKKDNESNKIQKRTDHRIHQKSDRSEC